MTMIQRHPQRTTNLIKKYNDFTIHKRKWDIMTGIYFNNQLKNDLHYRPKQKMTWIEHTTCTIQKSIKDHKTKMQTGHTDIRKFLLAPNKSH